MKKQLTLILTLILLVGVTVGVLVLVSNMETKQKEEEARVEQEKILMSLNSNDINKIEINTANTVYSAYLDENGKWKLENDMDFEINTYYLNSLATQLSTLKASEIICPISEADLENYGLSKPANIITLYTNDTVNVINVGKLSATEDFYYVTIDGKDNVYGISADYADYLNANKNSLKSIYILRNSDSAINSVSLKAHGQTVYELKMNSENVWEMEKPLKLTDRVNISNVTEMLTTIRQMIVDRFGDEYVTEDKYKEYGFDDPEYIFEFTQENGETTTLLAQDYEADGASFVTLICKETGQIFYMQSNYTSFLQGTADAFILKTAYTCAAADIDTVDINWNDRTDAEIIINEDEGIYTLNGKSLDSDAAVALNSFYKKLTALKYDNLVIECPIDKSKDPEITVTYVKKDGTKNVFEFYKADSENYAVFMDGEYQDFTVVKKNFTAREGIYDFYDRLLDAAGIK
ncbi:MAG: DUF4340 domain-containing protein [Ruminococcus sp.]|nr:DUF4340 domain-containing protein [Ruminococcus sp.]